MFLRGFVNLFSYLFSEHINIRKSHNSVEYMIYQVFCDEDGGGGSGGEEKKELKCCFIYS